MKKKILISLFTLILSSFFIVSLASKNDKTNSKDVAPQNNDIMINSPLFTSKEDYQKKPEQNISWVTEEIAFELVYENDKFQLYIDPTTGTGGTGAIRVVNKLTGYVWCSDVPNYEVDSNSTKREMKSSIKMSYTTIDKPRDFKYDVTANSNINLGIDKSNVANGVIDYTITNTVAKINFKYTIKLTESGIDFDLKRDSIQENNSQYILKDIQVFPYLGTTINKEMPGYVFIPSGNGALVRYSSNSILSSTGYTQRYYGSDENYIGNNEADVLSLPVFGLVHGVDQDAMVARIKSGAAMAKLTYIPAVGNNPFNRTYNTFTYREATSVSIPGGSNVNVYDKELTNEDISMSYSFLSNENANYIGMAIKYQQELVKDNILSRNETGNVGVHVDVFGGETENGILFDKFVKMTTTNQIVKINDQLREVVAKDVNLMYTLRGYYNGGYSYQSYNNVKFNSKLGSLSDLEGLDYSLYFNPVESYNDKLSYPSNVLVSMDNKKHYVEMEENEKYKFYTNVDSVISGVETALGTYDNIAIDALGYRLYGDNNAEYRRTDTMDLYSELLGDSKQKLYRPNEYLLANTSEYLTTPLYHGRLRFITDSVPFLQIVLRGYIDYYSSYLNFSTNQDIDLLKCIEYGSNPAYLISHEESHLLANTLSNHLYATHYESNKATMINQITEITTALAAVKGATIQNRVVLDTGVVVVSYSNNVKIYVNYTNSNYTVNDQVVVESMGYKVV